MKTVTKISLLAAAVTALSTSVAFADDQQLQSRLLLQQAQRDEGIGQQMMIGVYSQHQGLGSSYSMQGERTQPKFELRQNAHGQQFGVFTLEQ